MLRDDLLFSWLKQLPTERRWHWLDIGAGDGSVSTKMLKLWPQSTFHCIDVKPEAPFVHKFDGKHLSLDDHSFDFVLINFVLHHAASNMEMLILEAARVTRGAILIQEDIDDGTEETRAKHRWHDPNGIFLSVTGWIEKFKALLPDCSVIYTPHETHFATDHSTYNVPRALFVLSPKG